MINIRSLLNGIVFIVVIALLLWLTVAVYQGRFRSTVDIQVATDRAGLTMSPGAKVKLRGVEIGRVEKVDPAAPGARLTVQIDADKASWVGRDASAQIVPPTAFGAKYVQLRSGTPARTTAIVAGDTIRADAVTVEVDDAFVNLAGVLQAAQPDKVNNAVTALSSTLDTRGDKLGGLLDDVQDYSASLNSALPQLDDDLRRADRVVGRYDELADDLVRVLARGSTTAKTIDRRRDRLAATTRSLDSVSSRGTSFVRQNDGAIERLLSTLTKPTAVLARYSPALRCTLEATSYNGDLARKVFTLKSGITTYTKLQPSDLPYQYPQNLPRQAKDRGSDCFGMPRVSQADADRPNPDFGTGATPYADDPKPPTQELSETFFGALAGLLGGL